MKPRLFALVAGLALLALTAWGETSADIRRRMEQRLPQIDALKAQEVLGENNRGMLEERKSGAGAAGMVAEENRDRAAVYAIIAKDTGATPESVGRARAKQISANSRSGVWVQDESGRWQRK